MKNILSIYPNCSKGGMATVYRARALAYPDERHDFLFMNDRGGRATFDSLPNSTYRVVSHGRFAAAAEYTAKHFPYDEIRVTSLPEVANTLAALTDARIVYELHTSTPSIIEAELGRLELEGLETIVVPSQWLANRVARRLPASAVDLCTVVPNLIDTATFHPEVAPSKRALEPEQRPLVWVGRFDKGKNINDFFRLVSLLPDNVVPIAVVSYETEPQRTARALLEARAYGLADRIQLNINLSQQELASLYAWARDHGGAYVSTSLSESFGYGVAEALACGLPAAAYRVGGLPEVPTYDTPFRYVSVGSVRELHEAVCTLAPIEVSRG